VDNVIGPAYDMLFPSTAIPSGWSTTSAAYTVTPSSPMNCSVRLPNH
jgi:hypothetical protein